MLYCRDDTHPDAVLICPYDSNHKIARGRFQRHLVKCEKNFPEGYLEICPFDASHRLSKAEMKEHIVTCPMRRFMDPSLYQRSRGANTYRSSRSDFENTSTIDFMEDWSEDESDTQSKKPEFHSIPMGSKSSNERESEDEDEDEDEYYKPLRRPYGYSMSMLMEGNDPINDDTGSIMSCMGVGRGRGATHSRDRHLLIKIGSGRGRGIVVSGDP